MGGGSKGTTAGYKYYLGIHMILCHGPIDFITKLIVDGKEAWSGSQGDGSITFSAETLFGGEDREGGVSGVIDVQLGTETQLPNSYLVSQLGSMVPGYRGVVGAVLKQCYVGMNPYIKRWAFRATRIHTRQYGIAQWYDAKSAIGTDMNPAHIIRECLTDPDWGMGYPESDMDDAFFTAAADTLYSEGMGISLLWDKSKDLSDFVEDILKHIQGSLYISRSTGKFVLKLTRADYSIGSLITLNEDSINKITDFKRSSVGELINSVTVIYWDASTGNDGSVTVQDIALISQQQAVISTKKQYPGFTTGANAVRAASTELKALSTPLASATIYATRKAASLNIGDCFILEWPRYGVVQVVCRVTSVELGSLDSNIVKLSVIEDVFAQVSAVYAAPPQSGWVNPNSAPAPCPYHCLIEAPYWELMQWMGETQAKALPTTAAYFAITGVRPTSDARNAKIYSDFTGSGFEDRGVVNFCPTAVVAVDISYTATVLPLSSGVDIDLVKTKTYAVMGGEIIYITAISSSSMTVGRGCLDTVPLEHAAGVRVFFADEMFSSDSVEYATGEICRNKLLPTTGKGVLAIASATDQTSTAVGRAAKPYPPQQFRINGVPYPSAFRFDTELVVNWAHRDRLQQTATIIDTLFGSIGPEAGTTYTIEILNNSDSQIFSSTDQTGTQLVVSTASLGSDLGRMRIRLYSVLSGRSSFTLHDFKITRAGYGAAYGYSYGGA